MAFNLSKNLQGALGDFGTASALSSGLQPNSARNTTATNLMIVVDGIPQGLLRSVRVEKPYDQHRIKVLGAVVNAAIVPGVTEPSASISKVFLFGQTLNDAFGGNIRPVVGKRAPTNDFTKFYFDIVEIDALGNPLTILHDCALASESKAYDIDSVIIMEEASIYVRWIED
jgi:hypothetical protein